MQLKKKFIRYGTGTDDSSATDIPANRTATNYTPSDTSIKGHLDGIDTVLGSVSPTTGDIIDTAFAISNNQASAANVTGFAFSSSVRSFKALVGVSIDATSDLFEENIINGINKGSGWDISISTLGDNSLIVFSITSGGQIQYTSASYAGFVSGKIKFRAWVNTTT